MKKVVFEDRYCRPESAIKDGDRLKSVELVERYYDEDGSYVESHPVGCRDAIVRIGAYDSARGMYALVLTPVGPVTRYAGAK